MRTSPLSAIAVVALLVFAGCTGLPSTGENQPTPDEFPNASAIDQSVFDRHATEMENTSFTLSTEKNRTDRVFIPSEKDFRYMNDTGRFLAEPGSSQYLAHTNGTYTVNGTTYSNGSTTYVLPQEDTEPTVRKSFPDSVYNESSERYLWGGWVNNDSGNQLAHAAIDATFQREGVETFQGVSVMRYEATGVDAIADSWAGGENASSWYEDFSATLLLDKDGVIRHFEYEFVWIDYHTRRISKSYTLSDVGSTDVEKPDWVANATAES